MAQAARWGGEGNPMLFNPNDLIAPAVIFIGLLALFFIAGFIRKKLVKKHGKVADVWFRYLDAPVETLVVLTAVYDALASLQLRWTNNLAFHQIYVVGTIASIAWFGVRFVQLMSVLTLRRFDAAKKDNHRARNIHRQVRLARRLAITIMILIGVASGLMSFAALYPLGLGLLTVLGIACIIAGLSAHRTLGRFFTGVQVALAQPIRIDDIVSVEGLDGRIEEINLTHVLMRTQDERVVVFPIEYFNRRPFVRVSRPIEPLKTETPPPLRKPVKDA
jgi:small-conductance mechanosensitive channel